MYYDFDIFLMLCDENINETLHRNVLNGNFYVALKEYFDYFFHLIGDYKKKKIIIICTL